jgi:hypothetical protein
MNPIESQPAAPEPERRGRGRPPKGDDRLSVRYILKMLPEDRAKLEVLGGAVWLRQQIRKARVR